MLMKTLNETLNIRGVETEFVEIIEELFPTRGNAIGRKVKRRYGRYYVLFDASNEAVFVDRFLKAVDELAARNKNLSKASAAYDAANASNEWQEHEITESISVTSTRFNATSPTGSRLADSTDGSADGDRKLNRRDGRTAWAAVADASRAVDPVEMFIEGFLAFLSSPEVECECICVGGGESPSLPSPVGNEGRVLSSDGTAFVFADAFGAWEEIGHAATITGASTIALSAEWTEYNEIIVICRTGSYATAPYASAVVPSFYAKTLGGYVATAFVQTSGATMRFTTTDTTHTQVVPSGSVADLHIFAR